MHYDTRYPGIADLKARARKRLPNFAFDYVNGAIDDERGKQRNREAFHNLHMTPRYLRDVTTVDLTVSLFDRQYAMPFGVPPVGLGNMIWPGSETALAQAAQKANIPYILSTFSTTDMRQIAELAADVCWFQLYVPQTVSVMQDLIAQVKNAGFHVLVVTLDIPVGAKRNRELKNGLQLPFRLTPNMVHQALTHPLWSWQTLRHGMPDFVNVARYRTRADQALSEFITQFNMKGVTAERLRLIRRLWSGPLVVKGVQYPQDALEAMHIGVDGVIISNHGGRQLDAAPSSIDSLRQLPDAVHQNMAVMIDSGVRSGLDVVRSKALGAQMAFSGRSCFYAVGALGGNGAQQVVEIYRDEITRTLQQLGCVSFAAMDGSWLAA